ncbi:helix-turn-helix transcriptional regulator [Bacteroides clarus]|uniref:helix-turn-helix transcriptional regulator n=1 Tax=Bacteroides clarus TaxID=626929 RepID=UPI003FEF7077
MIKTFSYIGIGTPLPEAIDRLLHGRVKIFNHRRQTDYIRSLCYGNVEKLHQILHTIDEAVQNWESKFFISKYRTLPPAMSQEEADEIFFADRQCIETGMTELTADFLYAGIEKYGFINDLHRSAVETAWHFDDLTFLRTQWEDAVLEQIRSLRGIVVEMLATASEYPQNKPQTTNRRLKRIEDYPEVFGMDICCLLTGYSKDTIYKLTAKNGIPCYRSGDNGRKLVFKREEIVEWTLNRRQETNEEFIERMEGQLAARLQDSKN